MDKEVLFLDKIQSYNSYKGLIFNSENAWAPWLKKRGMMDISTLNVVDILFPWPWVSF